MQLVRGRVARFRNKAPPKILFRSQKPLRVADEVRNPNLFVSYYSISSNISRWTKVFVIFFGGLTSAIR